MKKLIFGVLFIVGVISCKSSGGVQQTAKTSHGVTESTDADISIAIMIRRLPGVHVIGGGTNAIIRIRGGSGSFISSNEPLFVVNDQIIDGGYSAISRAIHPNDVKTIEVLKNISDLSMYGARGANGVIKITTR